MSEQMDDDIDQQLQKFEALVDKNDPEQVKLLEEMRAHTKRLHQGRGEWNKPSTFRMWNDPTPPSEATAPLAIDSYRAYKQARLQDTQPVLAIAGSKEVLQIESHVSNPTTD